MTAVLVTGGSGFIASHTILQLLGAGHQVRTTVRSLSREAEARWNTTPRTTQSVPACSWGSRVGAG